VSNPFSQSTKHHSFFFKTNFIYSQAGLYKPTRSVGRNAGARVHPSLCPFAVDAPAAGSNRCFLVFFSRESPRHYLQWNAKKQHGTYGPTRSHIPLRASRQDILHRSATNSDAFLGSELCLGTGTQKFSQIITRKAVFPTFLFFARKG